MKLRRNTKSKRVKINKRKLGTSIHDRLDAILTREDLATGKQTLLFVKVYFTHPYASYERGTNERHNGLLRRFIPKGNAINNYNSDEIGFVEDWCNTPP